MAKTKSKPYPQLILDLLAEKTAILSKAQALVEMGMPETALPLWASAASHEERLAPLLEGLGKDREAAVHRISAASCYQKAGDPSRAANLYRAALAGPLRAATRRDVQRVLSECLFQLTDAAIGSAYLRGAGKVSAET
jgi:tetratricopeptide (TPR) repeat protein